MTAGVLKPIAFAMMMVMIGCRDAPERPAQVRPDWSDFAVDGLAPLMSPEAVEQVLAERGYKAISCVPGKPVPRDALRTSDDPSICYEEGKRNWRVSMAFLNLVEGRQLAILSFDDADWFMSTRQRWSRATLRSGASCSLASDSLP